MKYRKVNLGTDYPGKITDFSEARNSFLRNLPDGEYVFFVEEDEEVPKMLLDYIARLEPEFPYYNVRRLNLLEGRYIWHWNPEYVTKLCSNKMRFKRPVHEVASPRFPHGRIDIPTIHNSPRNNQQPVPVPAFYNSRAYGMIRALHKIREAWGGEV
jgi:hypothetical protein